MHWLLNHFRASGLHLYALDTDSALWPFVGPRKVRWSGFPLVKSFSCASNYNAGRPTNGDLEILTASPTRLNSILSYRITYKRYF